jgi:hypothetical protein
MLLRRLAAVQPCVQTLSTDVEYIKHGVDDVRFELKDQVRRFDALPERVTRVEESTKQAHKRLAKSKNREDVLLWNGMQLRIL